MFRWLNRKPKNRRNIERAYMLDVKLRTGQSRAVRVRLLSSILAVVFILAAVTLVFWRGGQMALNYFIYKNNSFAIRQIDISTDGVLASEVLRQWAGVKNGDNLLALDLMAVKRTLEQKPVILEVAVERLLPNTLKIHVNEREPVAETVLVQAHPGGHVDQTIYDFDDTGVVMPPLDPRLRAKPPAAPNEHLPQLTGVTTNDISLGKPTQSTQIKAAVRLLRDFDHSPMTGLVELKTIDVSAPEILQAVTSQGAQITFSLNQFDTQFRRWRQIYDQYQRWGKAIATLDLSITNNLPVKWVAAGSVPAVTPKAVKPVRTKRKNV